ncbi:Nn.00g018450.m01.CDS01 [Neocucurbitaria sp. VM-36]
MPTSPGATAYLIHHFTLPLLLPQENDSDVSYERDMIDIVVLTLHDAMSSVGEKDTGTVSAAINAIKNLRLCRNDYGAVDEAQLDELLGKLINSSGDAIIPLQIKEQNAGVLISRSSDSMTFEFFELSPTNEAAMSKGRLIRIFPSFASKIAISKMEHSELRELIAHVLAKMSSQTAPAFQYESTRDTAHPGLITDYFMNVTAALGETTDAVRIRKHTREEVLWQKDCKKPWRRSALWLFIRVTLQLFFNRHSQMTQHPNQLYKVFMVLLLSRILDLAKEHWDVLGSDPLHAITAKIVRRIRKLEDVNPVYCRQSIWANQVWMRITTAHDFIASKWKEIHESTVSDINTADLGNLRPDHDLDTSFPILDAFLSAMSSRRPSTDSRAFSPTSNYPVFHSTELPHVTDVPDVCDEYTCFRLVAMEQWVEEHLLSWVEQHRQDPSTCGKLRNLIEDYHPVASKAYAGIPVSISIMYLTIFEIWVMCDTLACFEYPTLLQYDPEVQLEELQCLCLPLKRQLERLHEVEVYMHSRQSAASKANPSVYRDFGHPSSFAVNYFDQTPELQALMSEIEDDASVKRQETWDKLGALKDEYSKLMDSYNDSDCDFEEVVLEGWSGSHTKSQHKEKGCKRCALKQEADALKIAVYEWPLSNNPSVAKATVFELDIPDTFSNWRDASVYLIANVLEFQYVQPKKSRAKVKHTLEVHHDLSHMLSSNYWDRRIILLSETKPLAGTIKRKIFELENRDVCVNNDLTYAYYDKAQELYSTELKTSGKVTQKALYQMPQRSKTLGRFLYKPHSAPDGLPANEPIASMGDCPSHFSVDEYKDFGVAPLGRHIIYANLLVRLAAPNLDFAKAETQALVSQIVQQVGPPNERIERVSHDILKDESFSNAMLDQLELALCDRSENWESWRSSAIFSLIVRRILSLTSSPEIVERCHQYLARIREIAMDWLQRLKQRTGSNTDEAHRNELHLKATEAALLCITTFDIEEVYFDFVLKQPSAISILIQCSIKVQENVGSLKTDPETLHSILVQSWRSLMYRIFPKLRDLISLGYQELNHAVASSWAAFQPASRVTWSPFGKPHEHWYYITSGTLTVYFNFLTAELLVDGTPLTRLPLDYAQHPLYAVLFKDLLMDVGPTSEPGIDFSAKSSYRSYKIHLGMTGGQLLVVAVGHNTRLNLIPSHLFQGRLPSAFLTEFVHWYDHTRDEVVFRNLHSPWASETEPWRLKHNSNDRTWRLTQGSSNLISSTSRTACVLSGLFQSLEDQEHIHIVFEGSSETVNIELPRLQLGFYVGQLGARIYSRQFRDMVIDSDQNIGTLVGLSSKLVLRNEPASDERLVLVPAPRQFREQSITYEKAPGTQHVLVSINKDDPARIFSYSLDTTLGRMTNTGDIQSQLFLCYLHAITSFCLPDPLIERTGVEAAITILQSAAVRSFEMLSEENVSLLSLIGSLSATRTYYPPDEMNMQQVAWDEKLSPLSQHPRIRMAVREILDQAMKMNLFHPESAVVLDADSLGWTPSDPYLEERNNIRSSTFRVCEFGAENFTTAEDVTYNARDKDANSKRGRRAFLAATMILRDQAALHNSIPDLKATFLHTHFQRATIKGLSSAYDTTILHYDSMWLKDTSALLADHWCNLHTYLGKSSGNHNSFTIMVWLSTMAYAETADMVSIQALSALFWGRDLARISPPPASAFHLTEPSEFNLAEIEGVVKLFTKSISACPQGKMPREDFETQQQHAKRTNTLFVQKQEAAIAEFVAFLKSKWLRNKPPPAPKSTEISTYLHVNTAMASIREKFKTWHDNKLFLKYLQQISRELTRLEVIPISAPVYCFAPPVADNSKTNDARYLGATDIFAAPAPVLSHNTLDQDSLPVISRPIQPTIPIIEQPSQSGNVQTRTSLRGLIRLLDLVRRSKCEEEYVEALRTSCTALQNHDTNIRMPSVYVSPNVEMLLRTYLRDCQNYLKAIIVELAQAAKGMTGSGQSIAFYVQHFFRICPVFWLGCLRRECFDVLPESWKTSVVEHGFAVTQVHRAQRLVALLDKPVELAEELQQVGHSNWSPRDWPETLLLEAESGIMIRPIQETIAKHMRSPEDAGNTVMQLNMGEGKSSTILPIVAAALSDKQSLVRVIVAKPQSKQMLQMLVSKLGGLLNRRIYHMPFSRALRFSATDAEVIRQVCQSCMETRGILLIQPEHILSLKLMGIELRLMESESARPILGIQQFLDEHSRDIVDESDENFNVKFELIYTMGPQQPIDLSPQRWVVIQNILGLVTRYAHEVKKDLPLSIEVQTGKGGRYPKIRILRSDAGDLLLALLSKHIIERGLTGFPTRNESPNMQTAIHRYISYADLTPQEIHAVENSAFWTDSTKEIILLIRGLFAGGILRFVLTSKRWRVNYGLDTNRTPSTLLAVPFRFKDGPSPRAEFSHPDVLILLSLLSHYYGGLSDQHMFDVIRHLLKSDQATVEYSSWVSTAAPNIPASFRSLSGINIKDRTLCIQQLFPYLRYSKACIDFFLSRLVFPKEVRQFTSKISASGWDLGAIKPNPTTGFSGTSDTQHVLPIAVNYLDLPSQRHTNALVLGHILSGSDIAHLPPLASGTDAEHLVTMVIDMKPEVRVILDCGAQILEQDNRQVAETWLKMSDDKRIQAAVFFEDEELSVLDRAGRTESLQISPFLKHLDLCVVFLDEAHTRGTDLKLPRNYRAAVTLGAGLTKDRLMQACMRMRKLGQGQSVTFIIPEEILTKIRERTRTHQSDDIELVDVLCWSISESWLDLKKSMPLWAVQGARYLAHERLFNGVDTTKEQAVALLEDEAQTLEARYKPKIHNKGPMAQFEDWDTSNSTIQRIVKRCQDFNAMGFTSADLEEEQERELAPEQEEEREIERPAKMKAAPHLVHADLHRMAKLGEVFPMSKEIIPAFQALRSTSAGKLYDLSNFPTGLLVTKDFMRTIKIPRGSSKDPFIMDAFQRPVQWIVTVPDPKKPENIKNLVILSPHEANDLLPDIRKYAKVTLHVFAPRTNVNYESLDDLQLWNVGRNFKPSSVSRSLTMQLNLFAGTLYLRSYEEYTELCDMLGILHSKTQQDQKASPDGFIMSSRGTWGLRHSPVPCLRALVLKIRREGGGLGKTHMGKILNGELLEEADFTRDVHMIG